MANLSYTSTQVDNAIRLILEPGHLAAQLDELGSPVVTAIPIANTEYKIAGGGALILTAAQEFAYDSGNDRFFFSRSGAVDIPFVIFATQSFSQTAASAEVTIRLFKNGTAVTGIYVKRTVSNSNTVGVIALAGHLTMSDTDYLELYVESTKTGNFNAWSFSSDLKEEAQ